MSNVGIFQDVVVDHFVLRVVKVVVQYPSRMVFLTETNSQETEVLVVDFSLENLVVPVVL